MSLFRERKLGVADRPRRYDLPLEKGSGGRFLGALVGLMAYLLVLSLGTAIGLQSLSDRWSSGLEGKMTVEIPALTPDGAPRSKETLDRLAQRTASLLKNSLLITQAEIQSDSETRALLSPWLPGLADGDLDLPVPRLINATLADPNPGENGLKNLNAALYDIAPDIRLETHKDWLTGILRLTGTMEAAAFLVVILIGVTTLSAIAGAVHSRMAEYRDEIELLHLMGAGDRYILRQFQRYMLRLCVIAGLAGLLAAALTFRIFAHTMSADSLENVTPEAGFGAGAWIVMCAAPLILCGITMLTVRQTVLGVLRKMP